MHQASGYKFWRQRVRSAASAARRRHLAWRRSWHPGHLRRQRVSTDSALSPRRRLRRTLPAPRRAAQQEAPPPLQRPATPAEAEGHFNGGDDGGGSGGSSCASTTAAVAPPSDPAATVAAVGGRAGGASEAEIHQHTGLQCLHLHSYPLAPHRSGALACLDQDQQLLSLFNGHQTRLGPVNFDHLRNRSDPGSEI